MAPARLTRQETRARNRRRLLDAAAELFERNGFATTTLDQIAEAAGLTTGAVYSNFASKEDLFLSLVDATTVTADVEALADPGAPLETQLERFAAFAAAATGQSPLATALHLETAAYALRSATLREEIAGRYRAQLDDLARRAGRARAGSDPHRGTEVDDVDLADVVLITQALVEGLGLLRAYMPERVTPELHVRAFRLLAPAIRSARRADRAMGTEEDEATR